MKTLSFAVLSLALFGCPDKPTPLPEEPKKEWQILASELPAALLSVSGQSASDVYAVGADKGKGPLVLHFDGKAWQELKTGTSGDLWWVHTLPGGMALMGGGGGTVLKYDGKTFTRLPTPGLAKQTVYGVWGKSADDFYAVGSAAGRSGFIWHWHDGKVQDEAIPLGVPRLENGEVPGFFKAWGNGDDVWIVGSAGATIHRKGNAAFEVVGTPTKSTIFTVHGSGDRVIAVGGASNGVLLGGKNGAWKDASPPAAGLLQGIFTSEKYGDWASGERGLVFQQDQPESGFKSIDHGLAIPPGHSLHSIFVDPTGGVWSVGGNVLTPALSDGVLIHYGAHTQPVVIADDAKPGPVEAGIDAGGPTCPADIVAAGRQGSVARRWDEQALWAIRRDLPRPTVHARNLFHMSAAMWDAWTGYDTKAKAVFVSERHTDADIEKARRTAISYAAFDVLVHRYRPAIGGAVSVACFRALMTDLGLDPNDTHDAGDDPIAFGNRIAHTIIEAGREDNANEAADYADTSYKIENTALVFDQPGTKIEKPATWQPINLSVAATQNGIILPSGIQGYIGAQWGHVTPFAMKKNGPLAAWPDPGPPPKLDAEMKKYLVEVIAKTASVDARDADTMDISPAVFGKNSLAANDGKGWGKNPVTGETYAPQVVKRGDFARVMAEFWADGPKSETPPGHWNTLANAVADAPLLERKLFGKGPVLDPLSWDVHVYLALNGAVHDAAIAAWGIKRETTTVRPITLIRWMGAKGQSSEPNGPSYDPEGLPLVPGLIEVITKESSAEGQRHRHLAFFVGQLAVRNWLGEPGDRPTQTSGVGWVRAVDWITYQRRTFVTPAFPAFISGHSTFSRSAAEVLTSLTGSPYFPGGLAEFVAQKDIYLTFEKGPTADIRLQWASYFDAADQAGQSRLWGSIHIQPDDFGGRRVGHKIGLDAVALATRYFEGR